MGGYMLSNRGPKGRAVGRGNGAMQDRPRRKFPCGITTLSSWFPTQLCIDAWCFWTCFKIVIECASGLQQLRVQEVFEEFGLASSKLVSSPVVADVASGSEADSQHLLDDAEKQLYDRLDLRYATSCLGSATSAPALGDLQAAKRVGRFLRKVPLAWQRLPICDPRPGVLFCYMERYSCMDRLSNVKSHHPKRSEIQRSDLQFL